MILPADGADAIDRAADALVAGDAIAIPTDTVYGLAALRADPLFTLKQRPREVEVPVLVAGVDQVALLAHELSAHAERLMARFWPGALTIVVRRRGGDDTVGVRHPDHAVPVEVCRRVGPLATTSANLHGQPTATTAEAVEALFGETVPVVLDGGACTGSPSTVVDCTGPEPKLLRDGRIPWDEVLRELEGSV